MSLTEIFESEDFRKAMEAERKEFEFYSALRGDVGPAGVLCYRAYQIEFDCDEIKMINEMVCKTGHPRSEIIREAVRYLYSDIIRGG